MRSVRPARRSFLGQCVRDLTDLIVCGLLWIGLTALALLQGWLLYVGELDLPEFLRESLSTQLAEQGLRADYNRVRLNPTGVIIAEGITLTNTTNPEPLLTAQNLLVRIDPWRLLTGHVLITGFEGSGLNVFIPAIFSPTGRSEPMLADAQFRLHFEANRQLTLDSVSGRITGLPLALDGSYTFPAHTPSRKQQGMPDLLPFYEIARQLMTIGDQLRQLGDLSVRGQAGINQLTLVAQAPEIDLSKLPESLSSQFTGEARNVSLQLNLPYHLAAQPELLANIEHLEISFPQKPTAAVERLQARLVGPTLQDLNAPGDLRLTANAHLLSAGLFNLSSFGLTATFNQIDEPTALSVVSRIDGQPWQIQIARAPHDHTATIDLQGHPTAGLLTSLEPLFPLQIPLTTLLQLGPPPRLRAHVELASNGLPLRASGHLAGGGAVAYHVPITEAAADFQWQGTELTFTNLLLRTGKSEARGRYTMDIGTLDFSFLLAGQLDPPDIGGWFDEWWTHFWADFDFPSPAKASVEVSGRWGNAFGTTVFVAAEGQSPTLRGQPLELLRTRLLIRPGWYDALDFYARESGGGVADGRFGLSMDIEGEAWKSLDFNFTSTLTSRALGQLLGPAAVDILEPYTFSAPPTLQLLGHANASGKRDISFSVQTAHPFTFHGYPIQDLDTHGRMLDDVLTLDPMRAHVAGGLLTGRTVISGPDNHQKISLDHQLDNAQLDTVIDMMAATEPTADNTAATSPSRRPGGMLKLILQAYGPLDQPTRLDGGGVVSITDAHFAQISLLGMLSDILKATGLGFTSLSLENLNSSYTMAGGQLTFPDLQLTGPSAVIDAAGVYSIDTQLLNFTAKLYPYESRTGMFSSAAGLMLTPLSKALEFQLTGDLKDPAWSFSYGLRGLLRTLSGESGKQEMKPAAPSPAHSAE